MGNQVSWSGDVSSSSNVAKAAQRKAPEAAGVRPQVPVSNCMEDPGTFIQAISCAFGYREPEMLSKYDLEAPISAMVVPAPLTGSPGTNRQNDDKRTAQIDKLTDEAWVQLIEKGYIDDYGNIQNKFRNTSEQDFVLSFSSGEKSKAAQVTREIYETIKRSDEGKIESRIPSSYILERTKAGSAKLAYNNVLLLLNALKLLDYVPDPTPGKDETVTRNKLIRGISELQSKHPEIKVSDEEKGNRVGPATINAIVQELRGVE